ncbi:hypothetical protein GON26_00415 [Flavobacterium sp. GA093]|uniref:Uncharacterized protein n=1 Tax=Flavobacterium hydrocarbonoxydans TaxID=2683249 RepID=A0A6I4NF36_9FLAO|nr:hypothetical protein [Flavobacterium hydrocarbonoxydans]MWB92818.1 hypothetical protein [Flavobacterium hydrocarbonoxydans]
MRIFYIIFFISTLNSAYSQKAKSIDLYLKTAQQITEMEEDLKISVIHVEVIETCSIDPSLCGNMAFGSTSLIKILDGKYKNQLLYISELCHATNYKVKSTYTLLITASPKFGVGICNNEVYHLDRTLYIKENRYPMLFGKLE